ncbi:MAG: hypothetical protein V9E87_01060 [Gemmatimonadales bacterium]
MSNSRRLRAVFQLALISAACWGLVGVVLNLIGAIAIGRDLGSWSPMPVFGVFGFYGLIAGAVFGVVLGLWRPDPNGAELRARRAIGFGGIGGALVFLLVASLSTRLMPGISVGDLASGAALFSVIGGLTGLGIQRIAKRGALPPGTSSPKSIAP